MGKCYDLVKCKHLEVLEAIKARIDGEWDNPFLLRFGGLSINSLDDVAKMVSESLKETEEETCVKDYTTQ